MDDPMGVIRARNHNTGDLYTTTRHLAARNGDEVLEDRPAVDTYGRWLPPKPYTTIQPARDGRGRFTSKPDTGEEEA